MITYCVEEEKLYHPDIGFYTAFGIAVHHITDDAQKLIEFVSDAFLEKQSAENFVRLCNDLHLDVVHLQDAITDTIAYL